jgi:transposase
MLSDAQWALIEPLVPGRQGDPGRHGNNNRLFVEAVLWILRTGSPWRDLPKHLGNWHSTFVRFQRWTRSERWDRLLKHLSSEPQLRAVFLDSTVVRAHPHAAGALKKTTGKASGSPAADGRPNSICLPKPKAGRWRSLSPRANKPTSPKRPR